MISRSLPLALLALCLAVSAPTLAKGSAKKPAPKAKGSGSGSAAAPHANFELPNTLKGKVQIANPATDVEAKALLKEAVGAPGTGKISSGLIARVTDKAGIPVYRLWDGPSTAPRNNRLGQWWTHNAPSGAQAAYRKNYEICKDWNKLTHVAKCMLKKGAIFAIGPGQSVHGICADKHEAYAADTGHHYLQMYIKGAWARRDLVCPPATSDRQLWQAAGAASGSGSHAGSAKAPSKKAPSKKSKKS